MICQTEIGQLGHMVRDVLQRDLTENWPVFGQPIDSSLNLLNILNRKDFKANLQSALKRLL